MKRALLVIDVQNEYFSGRLPITHPADHFGNILRAVHGTEDVPEVIRRVRDGEPAGKVFVLDIDDEQGAFHGDT